jgi:hypothetical protein
MKHEKASQKRQKSKTKNRAWQRAKQLEKQQQNQAEEEGNPFSSFDEFGCHTTVFRHKVFRPLSLQDGVKNPFST